jgi:hypothetical protein
MRTLSLVLVLSALSPACFAQSLGSRTAEFKAATVSPRGVEAPAGMTAALADYSKMYEEWIPADYGNALNLQHRMTWTEMTGWYKFASQEVYWLTREARRLNASKCPADPTAAAAAARTAASAKKLLAFIDSSPWGEGLKKPMTGEVRKAQAAAAKDWAKLARRLSGK